MTSDNTETPEIDLNDDEAVCRLVDEISQNFFETMRENGLTRVEMLEVNRRFGQFLKSDDFKHLLEARVQRRRRMMKVISSD